MILIVMIVTLFHSCVLFLLLMVELKVVRLRYRYTWRTLFFDSKKMLYRLRYTLTLLMSLWLQFHVFWFLFVDVNIFYEWMSGCNWFWEGRWSRDVFFFKATYIKLTLKLSRKKLMESRFDNMNAKTTYALIASSVCLG